jgi:hypothetical protein
VVKFEGVGALEIPLAVVDEALLFEKTSFHYIGAVAHFLWMHFGDKPEVIEVFSRFCNCDEIPIISSNPHQKPRENN